MELKGRLKLIADMTPKCNIVCDIGTDHAYIPIYLIKNDRCDKAVACDVKKGPIRVANKNIEKYGLSQYITTRVGDGVEPVSEGEEDVIIIAGMGGILIGEILKNGFDKVRKANTLIIQPMNAIEVVRQWLYENGFDIYDERLTNEDHKIYNVLACKWTGNVQKMEEIYYYIGEKLFENQDKLLKRFIEKKIGQVDRVIGEMEKMNEKDSETKAGFIKLRDELLRLLNRF